MTDQERYLKLCREHGWLNEDNLELWPEAPSERTAMARGLFGLAFVTASDRLFLDFKTAIGAENLAAEPDLDEAKLLLGDLTDTQKKALLMVADDLLDTAAYLAMIRLDRFDHGHIQLRLLERDEDGDIVPDSYIDIISNEENELFQDALQWKEDFSLGTDIGRREPCRY
ncbi:hypothetical protein SH528x_003189 [Novipirellula sp. SH528]|uniref:hypothetical protein n=1 Tax=Novipirellula sp. SH528 TaxID=3454466 RepID=UPI003F9F16A7